ncbi:MAG: MOSC domain-containing protein [Bdellovibrionaceae bacterium]|nr:MOSC domain-containing protein [Pseudobdellovibrionaceae bacterium]
MNNFLGEYDSMRVLAVCVGQPKIVLWNEKEVLTSIYKAPVTGAVSVKYENIEGDRQANLKHHGGVDKAVYAYSHDSYAWWKHKLGIESLPFGSLGENLTLDHLDEAHIFSGDVFRVGSSLLEAAQPRIPCFKLGIRLGDQKVIRLFNEYQRCGVYFRVKTEGVLQAGDTFKLISSHVARTSIRELFLGTLKKSN